jgi:hypothetical protein
MFHPEEHPMERGWVGRVDGERVVHLAAQTLQSYFLGGGGAREHAEYAASDVVFLTPVLHPPNVRVFEGQDSFAFANTSAVVGPGAQVAGDGPLTLLPRLAAVVGADGALGGFTLCGDWRDARRAPPKDRDFALAVGPLVVTPDELDVASTAIAAIVGGVAAVAGPPPFDWERGLSLAAQNTALRPGDVVAGPSYGDFEVDVGVAVELSAAPLGALSLGTVAA